MRYSRLIVFFSICFACAAVNFWLIMTRHFTAPLFVFLGCVLITPFIIRRLPPITTNPQEIRRHQQRAASALRRQGFMYIGALVLFVIFLVSGEFKDLPVWGRALAFCWSGFLIWSSFSLARRYKKGATGSEAIPSAEPKR